MNTKHLKAKILDLAIRGKLVPQDPSEGNAADLLQKIRDEKAELIKQKKLKEDKKSSLIIKADDGKYYEQFIDGSLIDIEDEIPFEIPENWYWCRLREITTILGDGLHGTPKYDKNGDYYFINGNNLENGKIIIKSDTQKVDDTEYQKYKKELNDNTVLVSINGTIGNIAFYNNEKIILGKSACYFNLISPSFKNYIYLLIKTSFFLVYATTNATGSTIKNVSLDTMRNFLLPFPPLSEQQRIFSAIEKAFEQIDIIEKNKLKLKTYIKQTKSKVLDLAIHGKLVEQNPSEGNAFELLETIRKEKNELIKQKKLKEDKKSSFIIKAEDGKHYEQFADGSLKDIEDEIPFEIPENWCWCRLRDIGIYKKGPFGSALTKAIFVSKSDSTIKVYEQQNAIKKNHELGHYYIKRDYFESNMKGFEVHPGDIIVSCAGTIGETYILPENIEKGIINQALMKMTITNELSVQFFLMYFDHILKTASADSGKGTAMKNIPPFDIFKQFLFPLPPLSEQKRIVKKINQIFGQLDILEKSIGE